MNGRKTKQLKRDVDSKIDVENYYYRDYVDEKSTKFVQFGGGVYPIEVSHITLNSSCLRKMYKTAKKDYLFKKRNG